MLHSKARLSVLVEIINRLEARFVLELKANGNTAATCVHHHVNGAVWLGLFDASIGQIQLREGWEEMRPGQHARINEHVARDVAIPRKSLQIRDAPVPLDPSRLSVVQVPTRYEFVAIEEKEFGGARNGMDAITAVFFKIR